MFLFILESIGTSELLLIGIVALIFLGPRKLPEYARKIGKIMAEFRGTANEFKQTWQREVNFEEEAKALDINTLESEPVAGIDASSAEIASAPATPEIKQIDPASFEQLKNAATANTAKTEPAEINDDKKNWL
ncbi:MAG: Sec-independent protein translocase protein TatB [Acidobacteriota bacterium]